MITTYRRQALRKTITNDHTDTYAMHEFLNFG